MSSFPAHVAAVSAAPPAVNAISTAPERTDPSQTRARAKIDVDLSSSAGFRADTSLERPLLKNSSSRSRRSAPGRSESIQGGTAAGLVGGHCAAIRQTAEAILRLARPCQMTAPGPTADSGNRAQAPSANRSAVPIPKLICVQIDHSGGTGNHLASCKMGWLSPLSRAGLHEGP